MKLELEMLIVTVWCGRRAASQQLEEAEEGAFGRHVLEESEMDQHACHKGSSMITVILVIMGFDEKVSNLQSSFSAWIKFSKLVSS